MPTCKNCKSEFTMTPEDTKFYERIKVPGPTLCPSCRRKRRLAHWPYGILRKRKCDLTGEPIVSIFPEDARFPVYKRDHWYGDDWDPPQQEIDWNRSFFDQLYELQCKTPHFHKVGKNNTNCDYADDVWQSKNIYLSRAIAGCEDLYYSYRVLYSRDSLDITYCYEMEQSYECVYCFKCYNLKFASHCQNCSDSYFLYDCRGSRNCFMCWNLRNKKYHILNQKYSKEEYDEKLKEYNLSSRSTLKKLYQEFKKHIRDEALHRADMNVNVQNSTGNYLTNCKNSDAAFLLENSEDCAYIMRSPESKDCHDDCGAFRGVLCYECTQVTDVFDVKFSIYSFDCHNCEYLDQCVNCDYCFGCVGLKRKKYCILNKQYPKEEYEEILPRLVEHMKSHEEYGECLPYKFAHNGFNLSLGAFYYSETPQSIAEKGGFWEAEPERDAKGLDSSTLPDTSEEITEDIIGKPINCHKSGKPFTFVKQELAFYRKHNLPLPDLYPEERNRNRYSQLAPFTPRKIPCGKCGTQTTTYYPESWQFRNILCNECYLKELE